jgi:hypothetical protein
MNLRELFSEAINVSEAFDTRFDKIEWEFFGSAHHAAAYLGPDKFRVYVEPALFTVGTSLKVWLNVVFAREVDGQLVQDLINTKTPQSRQLGAIVNALTDKISEITREVDVDAVALIVEKGQEKRISFYKRILLSKIYGLRPWQYRFSIEWFGGTALVATKKILSSSEVEGLTGKIEARQKRIDWRAS